MSESLIFNFSSTQDACFDRLRTEIYISCYILYQGYGLELHLGKVLFHYCIITDNLV